MSYKTYHFFTRAFIFVFFCLAHVGSVVADKPQREIPSLHEVDQEDLKVLALIDDLQREIGGQINVCSLQSRREYLETISAELQSIAHEYIELSPGTAFLGPLSTISLVLKQRALKKRIRAIETELYNYY